MRNGPAPDRFWAKVEPEPNSGCWLWHASWDQNGYGMFHPKSGGPIVRAHRFAYEMLRAPIPQGMELDHLCRVRACVNPAHLEPVTRRENIARGIVGIHNRRKTTCPEGHEYTKRNSKGSRVCYPCSNHRARVRRRAALEGV